MLVAAGAEYNDMMPRDVYDDLVAAMGRREQWLAEASEAVEKCLGRDVPSIVMRYAKVFHYLSEFTEAMVARPVDGGEGEGGSKNKGKGRSKRQRGQ